MLLLLLLLLLPKAVFDKLLLVLVVWALVVLWLWKCLVLPGACHVASDLKRTVASRAHNRVCTT